MCQAVQAVNAGGVCPETKCSLYNSMYYTEYNTIYIVFAAILLLY
jgi:hypothetical protein